MAATDAEPLDPASADPASADPAIARHRRLCAAFEQLIELPTDQRDAAWTKWREDDPALTLELEAMWRASQSEALQPPVEGDPGLGLGSDRGYRVLREIGRGGMGRVLLGERADGRFTRQVAIKVLDRSPHDADWRRRFLAEREILGRLKHPHIAGLLDAGEAEDGTPYLVMEFVDGVPLDVWLTRTSPDLDTRLDLFAKIAEAVAHAHQALIAHRDLKPGNVLVDTEGQPHLLDFGIARWLSDSVATATAERSLTPRYAAPEQVEGAPTTAAVDLYQLGLLLYVLLADEPAFADLHGAALLRAILHDDPPPPSRVARERRLPQSRQLSPELDAICARALRKRPEERYANVQALLDDLVRWREGEPVHAMRGGRLYRARKFARRHWRGLAATVLLAALTTGFIWRLNAELERTERERSVAEGVTELMIQVIGQADPSKAQGQELTLREALDQSVERLREAEDVPPLVRARLLQAVGVTYLSLSQNTPAMALLGEAAQAFRVGGDLDGEEGALHAQAVGLGNLGRHAEAQSLIEPLIAQREARGVANDTLQAELHSFLAILHRYQQRNQDMLQEFARAVAVLRAIPEREGETDIGKQTTEKEMQLAHTLRSLGDAQGDGGDHAAAQASLEESWTLMQKHFSADHPESIRSLRSLGRNAQRSGDHDGARRAFEDGWERAQRIFKAPDAVRLLLAHSLSQVLLHQGEVARAEELLNGAVAEAEQIYPPAHPNIATGRTDLARALLLQGKDDDARARAQAALDTRREAGASDSLQAEPELLLAVLDCRAGQDAARDRIDSALTRAMADPRQEPWKREDLQRVAAACQAK